MSLLDIIAKRKAEGIVKVEASKPQKQDLAEYENIMSVKPVLSSEPIKKTEKTVAKTTTSTKPKSKSKTKTTTKKTVSKTVEVKPIKKVKLFDEVIINNLDKLLIDKTTEKTILWATESYEYDPATNVTKDQILELINNGQLQPRVYKSLEERKERTKKKAEVFTPSWICKKMIDMCEAPSEFEAYIDSTWLEITCGETPFMVSVYETTTGDEIELNNRIGVLDRKLQLINKTIIAKNYSNEKEYKHDWIEHVFRAYKSCYGYEFQGDNLIIARCNLLHTFCDYFEDKWGYPISNTKVIQQIVDIITWNFYQMDGLKDTIPFTNIPATIRDWSNSENPTLEFRSMKET